MWIAFKSMSFFLSKLGISNILLPESLIHGLFHYRAEYRYRVYKNITITVYMANIRQYTQIRRAKLGLIAKSLLKRLV